MKGIIGLDIDGTVTNEIDSVPLEVEEYLRSLAKKGWIICFITGRPFSWAGRTLSHLDFPYYLAVQNGAAILEMPRQKTLRTLELERDLIPKVEEICRQEPTGLVVYGGIAHEDRCYFCPSHFSPKLLVYLKRRRDAIGETWQELGSFDDLPISQFASIKCFGEYRSAERISEKMNSLELQAPMIRDILDPDMYVVQATHSGVNKGEALKYLKEMLSPEGVVIAAGDDLNDLSMLEYADYPVVMENSPKSLHEIAKRVVASSIIEGLKQVVKE